MVQGELLLGEVVDEALVSALDGGRDLTNAVDDAVPAVTAVAKVGAKARCAIYQ